MMRTDTGAAITRCGLADGERTLPTTRRTTARVLTARTTATRVRLAPAAMLPSPKHTVRPERIDPGARVSTRLAGSLRQARTDDAVPVPAWVARMPRRIS